MNRNRAKVYDFNDCNAITSGPLGDILKETFVREILIDSDYCSKGDTFCSLVIVVKSNIPN